MTLNLSAYLNILDHCVVDGITHTELLSALISTVDPAETLTSDQKYVKVSDTRHLHEPYLSNKAAAFLLILERYLMEVANFIGNSKLQADTKRVGFLVHPDLQKIERALDDVIIHGINKPKYHLEAKRTRRYRYLKATLKKKYIDKSILMGIIDDSNIQNAPNFSSKNDGNKS